MAPAAAIALLAAAALAIGPTAGKFARERSAGRAPAMALASFDVFSPGVKRLLVFADGYELGRVSWVGKKPVALLEVRGMHGGLTQDLTGLLAVDPVAEEVLSLHPPAPATEARTLFATRTAGSFSLEIPPMPDDAPLADSFLVHARGSTARPIITLAQQWDSATPELDVLFRATEKAWLGPAASQWDPGTSAQVVLSPDGHTVCMLLYDEETGHPYLVERDVRARPLHSVGDPRTTLGADIVPTSLQYSPNGSKIAYLRRAFGDESELWLLVANGAERNGHRLATGIVSDTFAFSPDGKYIAVVMRDDRFGPPQVSLLDARLGEIEARFGPGKLCREAWHPSGRYFAFLAEDTLSARKTQQLYAAFARPPYPKSQITFTDKGLAGDYALSRDGEWAAAVAGNLQVPSLFFFELARLNVGTRTPGDAM